MLEEQKRFQVPSDELDSVIGRSRMPARADIDHLPYVQAIVKEVVRWRPVVPVGMPHHAREDHWYEGRLIPRGTIMLANIWAMHKDQDVYGPDASEFNPDRWINKTNNTTLSGINSDGHAGFGFGKRRCPGGRTAIDSLDILAACILWALKMEQKRDPATGELVPLPSPEEYPIGGITIHPIPFQFTATPQFEDVREIIETSKESLSLE
ncbi:cytochrome P450 family protein [Abortiporus biennis]